MVGGFPSRGDRYTASSTTPTISSGVGGLPGGPLRVNVRPSALGCLTYFRTKAWLTIATRGDPRRSASVKSRPWRRDVPYAWKNPGLTAFSHDHALASREDLRRPGSRRSCSSPSRSWASGTTRRHARHPAVRPRLLSAGRRTRSGPLARRDSCCASTVTMRTGSRSQPGVDGSRALRTCARTGRRRRPARARAPPARRPGHWPSPRRLSPVVDAPCCLQRIHSDRRARRVSPARCRTAAPSGWSTTRGERQHAPVERHVEHHDCSRYVESCAIEQARCPSARTASPARRPPPRAAGSLPSSWRARRNREAPSATAHAELVPPRGGARQQQVRDVGAGDEQHQRDHDHAGVSSGRWYRCRSSERPACRLRRA